MGHDEKPETPQPLEGAEGARSAVQPVVMPWLWLAGRHTVAVALDLHAGSDAIWFAFAVADVLVHQGHAVMITGCWTPHMPFIAGLINKGLFSAIIATPEIMAQLPQGPILISPPVPVALAA